MNTIAGILLGWRHSLQRTVALMSLLVLSACASVEPSHYADQKPVLDLQTYFNGTVDAWGIFTNRSGEVVKRFKVVIICTWQDGVGTLDEDFTYADGTKQRRVWTLKKTGEGRVVGTASDVIGEAEGVLAGNALRWRYTLALPVDGRTYHVQFDDWMYLMDEQVMLNKAVMSKWGFKLGEVTLSFTRRPATTPPSATTAAVAGAQASQ